jgi:hypothetical protein
MARRRNTGTYRKLKSGVYEISISLGYVNNKRKRLYRYVYKYSDEEAELELYKFLKEYQNIRVSDKSDFFRKKGIKYLEEQVIKECIYG